SDLPNFQNVTMQEEKVGMVKFSIGVNKGKANLKNIKIINNGSVLTEETIPANQTSRFEKTYAFETSSGINRFEFVAIDEMGLESAHITRFYNNTNIVKPDLYIAVVAIEKFEQSKYNLNYALKDANDVVNMMSNSKSFNKVYTKKIFNQSFTPDSVANLKKFFD